MTWKWDELTALDFPKAVERARGVCVVPIGCLEKHGDHLPLGADVIQVSGMAERAVEKEPALLFPALYFGQIHEAKHWPGAVALRARTLLRLLDETLDEIARNGLKKIILINGHGGNHRMLSDYCGRMLERPRDFVLYYVATGDYRRLVTHSDEWKQKMPGVSDSHAGEVETSAVLALRPELVRMQAVSQPGVRQNRLGHLPSMQTSIGWYANFPEHYAGDASAATADQGRFLIERASDHIAAIIKAVKEDETTGELQREFFSRLQHQ